MRPVSTELAAAIESPDRVTAARVGVDWNRDGYSDTVLVDRFDRASATSWGSIGGYTWFPNGAGGTVSVSNHQVAGGVGTQVVPVASAYRLDWVAPDQLDVTDQDMTVTVSCPLAAGGALEPGGIMLRVVDVNTYYMFRVSISQVGQAISASIHYTPSGQLATAATALVHAASTPLHVRAQVIGSRLRMKVWQGDIQPSAWAVQVLSNSQRSGGFGVRSGVASGSSNTPVTFRIHAVRFAYPSAPGEGALAGIDDLSKAVTDYSLDRAVTGDLPAAVRLVQGSAAAQASVTLGRGVLRPDAVIEGRTAISSTNSTTLVGPATFLPITAFCPWGTRRGDYLLCVLSATNSSGTALPYLVAQDYTAQFDAPPDPGWTARHVDVSAGTLVRTQVHGRWASDADVYYTDDARTIPYAWSPSLDNTAWSSVVVDLGPTVIGRAGVWKVTAAESAGTAAAGTVFTTPQIEVTTAGTVLVSVFAARTTSTAWSVTPDTVFKNTVGLHASTNISLLVCVSDPVAVGRYSRAATAAGSVTGVTTTIIAVAPQPGADERHHAAWQMSPLNAASPIGGRDLAALPATVDVEVGTDNGPQTVPRIRGYARSISASGDDRTAQLNILDRREDLRHNLVLPPIDGDYHGATATWPITWALVVGGWTPAPRPRGPVVPINGPTDPPKFEPRTTVSMIPMHGSLWPWFLQELLIGQPPVIHVVDATSASHRPEFVAGPFVSACHAYSNSDTDFHAIFGEDIYYTGNGLLFDTYVDDAGTGVRGRVQFWVRGDSRSATLPTMSGWREAWLSGVRIPGPGYDTYVGVNRDGNLSMRMYETGGGAMITNVVSTALPTDGAWHFVGIGWDFTNSAAARIYVRLDDDAVVTYTVSAGELTSLGLPDGEFFHHDVLSFLPMSDLQLSMEFNSEPWLPDDFVQDAFVDPSTLELVALAQADPVEAWDLITDIGAAENAVVYLDEDGNFHYRGRDRYLSDQMLNAQVQLTATKNITTIRAEHVIDVVRNTVTQPWDLPSVTEDYVWSLPEPLRLAPLDAYRFVPFRFDDVALQFDDSLVAMTTAPVSPSSYFIANTKADGSGLAVTVNLGAIVSGVFTAIDADIQWVNGNTFEVWITEAKISGSKVTTTSQTPALSVDPVSVARYGQQPLSLPSSPWIQTLTVAQGVASRVRADLSAPQVVITSLQVRGDPRLQLLDRVRIVDADGLAVDGDWWITGIREQHSAGRGYMMTIDARGALPVGEFDSAVFGQVMFGVAP